MIFEFSSIFLNGMLAVAALVGIGLLKAGLWPRRWGNERRCRRCEYVVENISPDHCPECGALLKGRGTVRGERRQRGALWGPGAFLLMIAVLWGGRQFYHQVDLYHLKPMRWVADDLKSQDSMTQERAWMELVYRLEARSLSSYWEGKMADISLAQHLAAPSTRRGQQSIDFLWRQYKSGRLSAAQVEQFFRQMTRTKWKIRPIVLVGQDLPYHVEGERYWQEGWMKFGIIGGRGSVFEGGYGGATFVHDSVVPNSARHAPGQEEVEIRYFAEYYRGGYSSLDEENFKPVWREEFVHRARVKVMSKASDEFLKVVDAPDLADQIRASMTIDKFGYHAANSIFEMQFRSKSPPINLAFDIFAKIDGQEYPLMQALFGKGTDGSVGTYLGGPFTLSPGTLMDQLKPKKVDLIFRSNQQLATTAVEFLEVWKGELIIKDVPVASPKE